MINFTELQLRYGYSELVGTDSRASDHFKY
jgi:hypothetical protein